MECYARTTLWNRRDFLNNALAAGLPLSIPRSQLLRGAEALPAEEPGVAVINHSVEDGPSAAQSNGAEFEGDDFKT